MPTSLIVRSLQPPVEICILTGGLSSRMGRKKSRLRLGRRTLLSHIRTTARKTDSPVRIIRRDLVPYCGPLGGVYTALTTTRANAVLFLSCDMPFVSNDLLWRIIESFERNGKAMFMVERSRTGFPFLLPRTALPAVQRHLATRRLSLRALARGLRARKLKLPANQRLESFNINTPEDFEIAKQLWRSLHGRKRPVMR
jgi:molybdopterin-guanine dinucleotide biosynthesis protein A